MIMPFPNTSTRSLLGQWYLFGIARVARPILVWPQRVLRFEETEKR